MTTETTNEEFDKSVSINENVNLRSLKINHPKGLYELKIKWIS